MKTVCFVLFFFANFLHAQTIKRLLSPAENARDIVGYNGITKELEDNIIVDFEALADHIEIHLNSQSQNGVILDDTQLTFSDSRLGKDMDNIMYAVFWSAFDPGSALDRDYTVSFVGRNHDDTIEGNCTISVIPREVPILEVKECHIDSTLSGNRFRVQLPCNKSQFDLNSIIARYNNDDATVNQDSRRRVSPLPDEDGEGEGGRSYGR